MDSDVERPTPPFLSASRRMSAETDKQMLRNDALVIVGGGTGRRFGGEKLFSELGGMPVFLHPMRELGSLFPERRRIMVVPADAVDRFKHAAERHLPEVPFRWAIGGRSRADSVRAGLALLDEDVRLVAIHDAARPLASATLLKRVISRAAEIGAAVPGRPISDTVKRVDSSGLVEKTLCRDGLYSVETPQCFLLRPLLEAYAATAGMTFTDDAAIMEYTGRQVALVEHAEDNLKLTWPSDLERLRLAFASGRP